MLFYGSALLYAGRPKQAEPVLKAALDAITATYGIQSMQAMQAQSALGNLYATEGDFGKALPYVAAAGERACALNGPTHQFCLQQQGNEGVIRFQLGDVAGALPKLKTAHAGFLQQAGPDSPGTHVIGYYFATALLETGDSAGAASLAATLDATKIEAGSPGDHWPSRVAALKGAILIDQHHVDEGMAQLRPAVEEMRRAGMQAWMIAPFEKRLTAGEKPLLAGRRI
jgi:tetratricopeptide (TPR) repeat protein